MPCMIVERAAVFAGCEVPPEAFSSAARQLPTVAAVSAAAASVVAATRRMPCDAEELSLTATLQAETNWKTAPKLQAMLQYRHLLQLVFGKCPNTIVSHGRLCAAVAAAHSRQPCIFGGVLTQVGVAQMSVAIRCGAATWKHAKQRGSALQALLAKAERQQSW